MIVVVAMMVNVYQLHASDWARLSIHDDAFHYLLGSFERTVYNITVNLFGKIYHNYEVVAIEESKKQGE